MMSLKIMKKTENGNFSISKTELKFSDTQKNPLQWEFPKRVKKN